jgi:hypothetical protein
MICTIPRVKKGQLVGGVDPSQLLAFAVRWLALSRDLAVSLFVALWGNLLWVAPGREPSKGVDGHHSPLGPYQLPKWVDPV